MAQRRPDNSTAPGSTIEASPESGADRGPRVGGIGRRAGLSSSPIPTSAGC